MPAAHTTLVHALDSVTFGPPATFQNLTLVPLVARADRDPGYVTLDEALAGGWAEITETSEGGSVPELKVVNRGDAPVLLLDGEELVGAKQDRVVNLTILVAAHKTIVIPVSCVEAGRWRRVSRRFSSAPRTQFAEGRAAKVRAVTASLQAAGRRDSNQGEVWDLIAEKSARLNVASPTSAMAEVYDRLDAPLDEFVRAFTPAERQVGGVFFINGRPVGLDLFDASSTWRKLAAKLVRGYAVDAIDRGLATAPPVTPDLASAFTADLLASPASVFPATGDGEDVRLTGPRATGAALVAHGRAIHVTAFPMEVA